MYLPIVQSSKCNPRSWSERFVMGPRLFQSQPSPAQPKPLRYCTRPASGPAQPACPPALPGSINRVTFPETLKQRPRNASILNHQLAVWAQTSQSPSYDTNSNNNNNSRHHHILSPPRAPVFASASNLSLCLRHGLRFDLRVPAIGCRPNSRKGALTLLFWPSRRLRQVPARDLIHCRTASARLKRCTKTSLPPHSFIS